MVAFKEIPVEEKLHKMLVSVFFAASLNILKVMDHGLALFPAIWDEIVEIIQGAYVRIGNVIPMTYRDYLDGLGKVSKNAFFTGQRLVGTSFSRCLGDLMLGKVPIEKVVVVFTNTSFEDNNSGVPNDVDELISEHVRIRGWMFGGEHEEKFKTLVRALHETGRIVQLRTLTRGLVSGDSGSPWLDAGMPIMPAPSNTCGGIQWIGSKVVV